MWGIGCGATVVIMVFVGFYLMHVSQEAAKKQLAERLADLTRRFGAADAARIMAGEIWQGQPAEQVFEALGSPVDTEQKVMKTKVKVTLKYDQRTAKSFGLRVFIEDGEVVGWERK